MISYDYVSIKIFFKIFVAIDFINVAINIL